MTVVQNLIANKPLVAVGAAVLAIGAWYSLSPAKVACNSPELFDEFQARFKEGREKLIAIVRSDPRKRTEAERGEFERNLTQKFSNYHLNIKSTTTLGSEGNMLHCRMSGDYGLSDVTGYDTEYFVGKDDNGRLAWRFVGIPPYQVVP
jgi:hypothetical protein